MKKFFEICGTLLAVAMLGYFLWSWHDIVEDNCQPNPVHSPYNLFILIASDKPEPRVEDGMCGSPLTDHTRVECGIVAAVDTMTNTIVVVDDTGNEWVTEVGYAENFDTNGYYCIFFDTLGTENIEDDVIVKMFVEKW